MQERCLLIALVVLFVVGVLAGLSRAEIDPNSIVGVWLLDEGEGNTAKDSSENGHNGEIKGNVKWVEGEFGKALEFPGIVGSYVDIPDEEGLNLVTWSITVWLKIKQVNGEFHAVIKEQPGNTRNYGVIVEPGFAYPTFTAGAAVWKNVAGRTVVADDEWHHVAATYDKTSEKLYVDGALDVQASFTDDPDTPAGPLGIGAGGVGGTVGPVAGVLDEVAVFNVALAEEDVNNIMNDGLAVALGITAVSPLSKLSTAWGKLKAK